MTKLSDRGERVARALCEYFTAGVSDEDYDTVSSAILCAEERGRRQGLEQAAAYIETHRAACSNVVGWYVHPNGVPGSMVAEPDAPASAMAGAIRALIPQEPGPTTEQACSECDGPCNGYRRPVSDKCACGAQALDWFIGTYATPTTTHTREKCEPAAPCATCGGTGWHPNMRRPCPTCASQEKP